MRFAIVSTTLLGASIATAGLAQRPDLERGDVQADGEIVVTARSSAAVALANCLARRCRPVEDISASLAAAEQEFLAGDYLGTRRVLAAALGRNRRFTAAHPRAVASLYDAHARMAYHYGDVVRFRQSTYRRAEILNSGLPTGDAERVRASAHVGDMLATLGD